MENHLLVYFLGFPVQHLQHSTKLRLMISKASLLKTCRVCMFVYACMSMGEGERTRDVRPTKVLNNH